jgi:hypothetical protein
LESGFSRSAWAVGNPGVGILEIVVDGDELDRAKPLVVRNDEGS